MTEEPWRAGQFRNGYTAEFIPPGQRTFRMLKEDGRPKVFASRREAKQAALDAYLNHPDSIRATTPPKKVGSTLQAEAEQFMRSRREDIKKQTTHHRAGKRPLIVLSGKG